jgi:hypothetical protein
MACRKKSEHRVSLSNNLKIRGGVKMSDWFPLDLKIAKPHPGHEAHLCMAHSVGFVEHNLAAKAENLCQPETL